MDDLSSFYCVFSDLSKWCTVALKVCQLLDKESDVSSDIEIEVISSRCSGVFKDTYFYKQKMTCLSPWKRVNPRALDVRPGPLSPQPT